MAWEGMASAMPKAAFRFGALAPEGCGIPTIRTNENQTRAGRPARVKFCEESSFWNNATSHVLETWKRIYEHNYCEYFRKPSERTPRENRSAHDGMQASAHRCQGRPRAGRRPVAQAWRFCCSQEGFPRYQRRRRRKLYPRRWKNRRPG